MEKIIYRLDDNVSFRKCSLADGKSNTWGDCTSFIEKEENFRTYYYCSNNGIHLHCTNHPEIEYEADCSYSPATLICPRCKSEIEIDSFQRKTNQCLRVLNYEAFKNAKLIRVDDWYTPEAKHEERTSSKYWIKTAVKTDKDDQTIVVVYVGHSDTKEKAQFFIKPEKKQLTSDHKDTDPANLLAKIELTLNDRKISHDYKSPDKQ